MDKKKINPKYIPKSLSASDRKKQEKSIKEGKIRPKVESFKSKRSSHATRFEKKYGVKVSNKTWISKNLISMTGINKIIEKGKGAYFSSGSRPNQTPTSWALARLGAVLTGSKKALAVDKEIVLKYGKERLLRDLKLK